MDRCTRFRDFLILAVFFLIAGFLTGNVSAVQDGPVLAPDISNSLPVFNGVGDDPCWQDLPWQTIDQVWIDYGTHVPAQDFTGKYKIAWSSETNLLYFLIEVQDDAFVGGFVPDVTAEIHNFDVVEVFIDEDKSGGLHLFDATGNDAITYGSNAENAFAYHIFSEYLEDDSVNTEVNAKDLDGTAWWPPGSAWWTNYSSHIPDFAMRKSGNTAIREFSLIVYNDTYETDNEETARVTLTADKLLGLSVAYCDNDNPGEEPKERDHFFGSVWVPAEAYNDHYMNADGYGSIKLVTGLESFVHETRPKSYELAQVYPNPANQHATLILRNAYRGEVQLFLYNVLGQKVYTVRQNKSGADFTCRLSLHGLTPGVYFVRTQWGRQVNIQKLLVQ